MRCVFCKVGETHPQQVTVERYHEAGELVALIENVPAEVCGRCGEEYYGAADWANVERLFAEGEPPARISRIPVYTLKA